MCGINGSFGKASTSVARMNHAITYRGPDRSDTYSDDSIALGMNRLAIVGLGEGGDQPMKSSRSSAVLVFNGEIYNYRELRKELESNGIRFRGNSDTEVVLEGLVHEGASFLSKLRGMWALAFWSPENEELLLSRDPFGIKPLYFYDDGTTVAFSSEIRGLLAHEAVLPVLDANTIQDLLLIGHIVAPRTILKHAEALLPGETLLIRRNGSKVRSCITLPPPSTTPPTDENLETILKESVEKHLLAEVPVGVFFSGGIDSTVVALMLQRLGVSLHAYHLSVAGREDSAFMEAIARHTSLDVTSLTLEKNELRAHFENIGALLDQPTGDTSFLPTYILAKRASEDVKVVLSGEGGDELFGGYPRHRRLAQLSLRNAHGSVPALARLAMRSQNRALMEGVRSFVRRTTNDPFTLYLAEKNISYGLVPSEHLFETLRRRVPTDAPDGALALDRSIFLPDDLLMKIDTATMNNSIEGRVPFVDREVWNAVGGAPFSWKNGKAPLKRLLAEHLPEKLLNRPKGGFSLPLSTYLFEDGSEQVHEACAWYKSTCTGLIPELDALLSSPRAHLVDTLPHLLYALVTLHAFSREHSLTL